MRVLLVNKFLYPKGGAETYVFKLGETLQKHGHEVQYFGLWDERNVVGNSAEAYVSSVDFNKRTLKNVVLPFRIIYSAEAYKKITKVLEDFDPDAVHFNNIQFHLTPSIILATAKYRKKAKKSLKIVYTAHDYQLICPSHGLFDSNMNICEKCIHGDYWNCVKSKCVKESCAKSLLAMVDAYYWAQRETYNCIDTIICPSHFLKAKLDRQERFATKTVAIHNFIESYDSELMSKDGYVLEFGHLSRDKGTLTLLECAKRMPNVKFVFAGYGEAEAEILKVSNAEYVGYKTGADLENLIKGAICTVCPSEMYENCPYSVMESQMLGTPVIGANIGGIPELIQEGVTGYVFAPGNVDDLEQKLRHFVALADQDKVSAFLEGCKNAKFETPDTYYQQLLEIYGWTI